MKITQEVFIKMVLDAWYIQINRTDDLVNSLPDEKLQQRVALGKITAFTCWGILRQCMIKCNPCWHWAKPCIRSGTSFL